MMVNSAPVNPDSAQYINALTPISMEKADDHGLGKKVLLPIAAVGGLGTIYRVRPATDLPSVDNHHTERPVSTCLPSSMILPNGFYTNLGPNFVICAKPSLITLKE
jgi:hypothetical protein